MSFTGVKNKLSELFHPMSNWEGPHLLELLGFFLKHSVCLVTRSTKARLWRRILMSQNMRGPKIHGCTKNNKNTEFEVEIILRQAYFSCPMFTTREEKTAPFCSETQGSTRSLIHPLNPLQQRFQRIFVCKAHLRFSE